MRAWLTRARYPPRAGARRAPVRWTLLDRRPGAGRLAAPRQHVGTGGEGVHRLGTEEALRGRDEHGVAHGRECVEGLVAVLARAEVGLREGVEADELLGIQQHGDLHAVADGESQALEQLASRGDLAGQGLREAGEPGAMQVQQRAGHQLGHAAALAGQHVAAGGERPLEGAFDQGQIGTREGRREEPGEHPLVEVLAVGVDVGHDLPGGARQGAPHGIALAAARPEGGHEVVLLDHGRRRPPAPGRPSRRRRRRRRRAARRRRRRRRSG